MKRIYTGIVLVLITLLGLYFVRQTQTERLSEIQVVASIYPVAEVVRNVVKDVVSVRQIVTGGQEPHDYSPSPFDIASIEQADLFEINGTAEHSLDKTSYISIMEENLFQLRTGL